MRRIHFRLALEPGLQGVVRLAQLHQYATQLVDGERVLVGPSLREHVKMLFPRRKAEAVLDGILGRGQIGWNLEGAAENSPPLVITTVGPGTAFSTIARIVELVAPEALGKPMTFEPAGGETAKPISRRLH